MGESSGHAHSAVIDLGVGDDRLILRSFPSNGTTVTLGLGRDVVEFDPDLAAQSLGSLVITDFETGAGGDLLDWNLFAMSELMNGMPGYNPFIDGDARLVQSGNDVVLEIRADGAGFPFSTLLTFQNTLVNDFTHANLGFDPNHPTQSATSGNDTLDGLSGVDVLYGLEGDDIISVLLAMTDFTGDDGADTLRGGDDDTTGSMAVMGTTSSTVMTAMI